MGGERQALDADDITAELRKAAERNRPDALDPDVLAKDHTDRQPEPLSPEKLREELHDQNLSTKEAVLEVRDELAEEIADELESRFTRSESREEVRKSETNRTVEKCEEAKTELDEAAELIRELKRGGAVRIDGCPWGPNG